MRRLIFMKIWLIGNEKNYFAVQIFRTLKQLGHEVCIEAEEDISLIICVNDIRGILRPEYNKIPLIAWIGERPLWSILWHELKLREADIFFVTDYLFIEELRKSGIDRLIYFLPLATNFPKQTVKRNNGRLCFVGNNMDKSIDDFSQKGLFKLNCNNTIKMNQTINNMIFNKVNNRNFIESMISLYSFDKDKLNYNLLYSYLGMLVTKKYRKDILCGIKQKDKLDVWGDGWEKYLSCNIYRSCKYENIDKVYSSYLVNLNISSQHLPTACNSRLFDVPISGGFLITDFREYIYKIFEEDEIVCYKNIDELNELIEFYMRRPEARLKIIKKAQKHIDCNHRYSNRINFMLDQYRLNLK